MRPATTGSALSDRRVTAALLICGSFGVQLMTAVTGILSARMLGVEGRGQLALVAALAAFASQITLGGSLPNAIAKQLAGRDIAARDGLRGYLRVWFLYSLAPSLIGGVVLLALMRHHPDASKYALALAVVLSALEGMWFRIVVGGLQGEGDITRLTAAGIAPQTLFTVALSAAFVGHLSLGPVAVVGIQIACSFVAIVFSARLLAPPADPPSAPLDRAELWSDTKQTYVSSIGPIDGLGLDRMIVGTVMGSAPLGLYTAATALANLSSIVGSVMGLVILPRVARAGRDAEAERRVMRRWLPLTAVTIAAVVGVLEIGAGPIIRLAFGEEFAGAIPCAHWLILADGLLGFRRSLIAVLQGQGRGSTASRIELMLTPVVVLGIAGAGSTDHLYAVGLSMTVIGVVSCAWLLAATQRRSPSHISDTRLTK